MREDLIKDIKRVIRIIIASLIIAANIKIFVNAGSLFPGGFTGLSILIQRSFDKFLGIGAYTNIERPLVYSIVSSENVKKVMTVI